MKHPRRGFLFSWHGVWAGVENVGREFSWRAMEWGTVKFSISFTPNSYFWKTSPNSKKHKIGQNWKISFFYCKLRQIL